MVPPAGPGPQPVQEALKAHRRPVDGPSPPGAIGGGDLELLQVLPQGGPRVLHARHAALLEQGDDLFHERADVARPEPLPDGEAVAADLLHGARHVVGDALGRPDERQGVEADLAGCDLPQGRGPAGHVELVELAADALGRPPLERVRQRLIERIGGQVNLQQRRERRQAGLDRRVGVQCVGRLLRRLVGVADDRLD